MTLLQISFATEKVWFVCIISGNYLNSWKGGFQVNGRKILRIWWPNYEFKLESKELIVLWNFWKSMNLFTKQHQVSGSL